MNGKRSPLGKATKRRAKTKENGKLKTEKCEAIKKRRKPPIVKHQRKREPTAQAERSPKTHPNRKKRPIHKKTHQQENRKIFEWHHKIS